MTGKQTRNYDAAVSGDHKMTELSSAFSTNTPLKNKQIELQGSISRIEVQNQKQSRNKGYATKLTNDLKDMGDAGWSLSRLVLEYAKQITNDVLEHKVAYGKSSFTSGSIVKRKTAAQTVHDAVTAPILTDMIAKGYDVAAGTLTDLQDLIDAVTDDQGKPKDDVAAVRAATIALKLEFKTLKSVGESIDNLMIPYAKSNKDFYNAVTDAFEPSAIGMRGIALRLVFVDSVTATRVSKFLVSVDGFPKLDRKASKRGIVDYSHQELNEGNYKLSGVLARYQLFAKDVQAVFDNKFTRVEVLVVRI